MRHSGESRNLAIVSERDLDSGGRRNDESAKSPGRNDDNAKDPGFHPSRPPHHSVLMTHHYASNTHRPNHRAFYGDVDQRHWIFAQGVAPQNYQVSQFAGF